MNEILSEDNDITWVSLVAALFFSGTFVHESLPTEKAIYRLQTVLRNATCELKDRLDIPLEQKRLSLDQTAQVIDFLLTDERRLYIANADQYHTDRTKKYTVIALLEEDLQKKRKSRRERSRRARRQ